MNENLILSLQITALGMGLVFAAIIVLSLMMSLLTRFTAGKADTNDASPVASPIGTISTSPGPAPVMGRDYKAQAAAIAVTLALAGQNQSRSMSEPPTALVSAWQLGMRTRQLYQKGMPLTRKARKAG